MKISVACDNVCVTKKPETLEEFITGRFVSKHCKLNVFCSGESHRPETEDQASCHDRDDHSYSAVRSP